MAGFWQARIRPRLGGGIWFVVGYLLSPLSWWNDAFINLPIAYGFASLVSLVSHRLFLPAILFGYWATNVLGLVLVHRGAAQVLSRDKPRNPRRELVKTLVASTLYTLLIAALVHFRILGSPFHRH
jgi:hypothetical protein